MSKKGGYQIISLLAVNLALLSIANGKPVLLTDINIGGEEKKDVFTQVEQITEDGETKYVLKNVYGYDLTIDSDATITWKKKELWLEEIVDAEGHKRFIGGDVTLQSIGGVTMPYGKWSLSGTHLLVVMVLDLANATSLSDDDKLGEIPLPEWVMSKIVPIYSSNRIELKAFTAWADNFTTQTLQAYLTKGTNVLNVYNNGNLTLTAQRRVRITYDLLIDNESN